MNKLLRFSLLSMLMMLCGTMMAEEVTDELTYSTIGVTGTSYAETKDISVTSSAIYYAQSAGGNQSIQLRSKNDTSGIVSTTSGGKVKSVSISFNSNTLADRVVSVYGSNTAYTAPSDLYDTQKQGVLLGEIAKSAPETITVEGSYDYIGIRSKKDAMYIEKITIVWETEEMTPATVAKPVFSPKGCSFMESIEVSLSCTTEGAKIYYTLDGTDPSTESTEYTAPLTLTETTTVTAIAAKEGETSNVAKATYTAIEQISVAKALETINELADNATTDAQYVVKGYVVSVAEISTEHGNATFDIADEENGTDVLTVYRTKGLNGEAITNAKLLRAGDQVAILGQLQKYVKNEEVTPELKNGSILDIVKGEGSGDPYDDEDLISEPVTAPENLVTEDYTFTAAYVDYEENVSNVMRFIKVGIQDDYVYINGLSYYLEKDSWIKGKLNAEKTAIKFQSPQYYGDYYGMADFYFIANFYVSDEDDTYPELFELPYNAETGEITIPESLYILEGAEAVNDNSCYGYYADITLTKGIPEPVVAPEGLTVEDYNLVAVNNDEEPVSQPLKVGFYQNTKGTTDLYIQGLSTYLPEAWVKGELSADGKTVTLEPDQYIGFYNEMYIIYFGFNGEAVELAYDAEKAQLTANGTMEMSNSDYVFDSYVNAVITKVTEKVAMPANPYIIGIGEDTYEYLYMVYNVPTIDTDGNGLLASKLSFQFYIEEGEENPTVSPLTFTTDLYEELTEDMTVIPYGFTDDYDFYQGTVYLNMDIESWNKVGIKSIYTGGGETRETEIQWYDLSGSSEDGVHDVKVVKGDNAIYSLSGQKVQNPGKGLYIVNGKKVIK